MSDNIFNCDLCNYKTNNLFKLNKHCETEKHKALSIGIKCNFCSKIYDSRGNLTNHVKYLHKDKLDIYNLNKKISTAKTVDKVSSETSVSEGSKKSTEDKKQLPKIIHKKKHLDSPESNSSNPSNADL